MTHSTDPPISSATGEQRGGGMETADQCFDWTRRLDSPVRGLVTTWLEIGDRAIRTVNIIRPATEASR